MPHIKALKTALKVRGITCSVQRARRRDDYDIVTVPPGVEVHIGSDQGRAYAVVGLESAEAPSRSMPLQTIEDIDAIILEVEAARARARQEEQDECEAEVSQHVVEQESSTSRP